ncbi:MAG: VWA domain-containing protein [Deltaproteobacteria bacterium]|nr:VWA domain-containing protein [Nannocystaceae bacterium]
MPRSISSCILAALAACTLAACAGNLDVTRINSEQRKPNNVWVFFTVEKHGEPVAGLQAEDFEIYEDNSLVSKYESQQVIQNPEVAAVMYTMLLLDMSGSVTESGQADMLADAAVVFSERVGKTQKVGVYAFDGAEKLHSVTPFTEAQGSVEGGIDGLRGYQPKDPSTNLHGAIGLGLAELKEALDKDERPLKFGTLVVFTDGTDRAGRVSRDEMLAEMRSDEYGRYEIYAIGVGAELEEKQLGEIGRDGTELATDPGKVREAFEKVAARIEAHTGRFYLLSYCTPARKGSHTVRVEAITRSEKGRKNGSGSTEYEFSAEGFGPPPQCDPQREPKFSLERVDQLPEDDDGRARGRSRGRSSSGARSPGSTSGSSGGGKASGSAGTSKSSKPAPRSPGGG